MTNIFLRHWHFLGPALILFVVVIASGCNTQNVRCETCPLMSDDGLKGTLRRDGFSGILDNAASLKYLGCVAYEHTYLSVYLYQREFGNARRLSQRLLIVSAQKGYLGMYEIPDAPLSVENSKILFPFPAEYGNVISLEGGVPPSSVLLDGEEMEFFK